VKAHPATSSPFADIVGGVKLPGILYGTAWKKDATERLVAEAIRQGFRGIDTACQPKHYDEAGVGRGVAQCLGGGRARDDSLTRDGALTRGDLFLQTKFTPVDGHDPRRIPYDPSAPIAEQIAQSFETSQKNLGTDYVDSLVLHSPLATDAETLMAWRALEAIAERGGARQLGISNCYSLKSLESLYLAARVKPAAVQNRFHKATGYDSGIRTFCRAHGIVYQSFWTLTANQHVLQSAGLLTIAARHDRTPAQVLFRYLTQQDIVPLTGTTNVAHMREDLAIFAFTLTDAEQAAVTALLR
jgi:diketogulonate reductase-like aldo/keto reductase